MPFVQPRHGGRTVPLKGAGNAYDNVTSGSGAGVKGAWKELHASLPCALRSFDVVILGGETGVWFINDVGIGAAGSEVVIVPNLLFQSFSDFGAEGRSLHTIPYPLPAGTRVAMRSASNVAAPKVTRCAIVGHAGVGHDNHRGIQRVQQWGTSTSSVTGLNVDPGGTVNTKGAWVQFVASTPYPIRRLMIAVVPTSAVAFMAWAVDIGIGAAGSEVVLIPDIPFHAADIGKAIVPSGHIFDVSLPAGVRLAVRALCESTTAGARVLAFSLYGMG